MQGKLPQQKADGQPRHQNHDEGVTSRSWKPRQQELSPDEKGGYSSIPPAAANLELHERCICYTRACWMYWKF